MNRSSAGISTGTASPVMSGTSVARASAHASSAEASVFGWSSSARPSIDMSASGRTTVSCNGPLMSVSMRRRRFESEVNAHLDPSSLALMVAPEMFSGSQGSA